MRLTAMCIVALAGASQASGQLVDLAYLEGELTENSPLAFEPGVGDFHYELYTLTTTESGFYTFTTSSSGFTAYWMLYPDNSFNPSNWLDPAPPATGSTAPGGAGISLTAGISYDLVFGGDYNPTMLGSFSFLVRGPESAVVTIVPSPGAAAFFGVGGLGLMGVRRRRN